MDDEDLNHEVTKGKLQMATKQAQAAAPKTEVATKAGTDVGQVLDFAADAGRGMEGADKASYAIPFLIVLQSNSPQIDTIEGAKAGKLMNTVTEELYDEVNVVPVAFQRRYLAWAPRASGGGFKGEFPVADVEGTENKLKWVKNPEGQMVLPTGDVLKDTRNHYVLILNESGTPMQAVFSFSSTQVKKSKHWMSRISNIVMKDANGVAFTPPSFSHIYKVSTIKESNDKGEWRGVKIDLVGPVKDAATYAAAKAFHALIVAGRVETAPPPSDGEDGGEKF